jgi:hypothetical protein
MVVAGEYVQAIEALAVQTWRDEKIIREQFYDDPTQLKT